MPETWIGSDLGKRKALMTARGASIVRLSPEPYREFWTQLDPDPKGFIVSDGMRAVTV